MNQKGFTLLEVIVSIVILAVAILGLSASTTTLIGRSTEATVRARAMNAVDDRLALVRMHPIYPQLDSIYSETSTELTGFPGYTRTTAITRIQQDVPGGKTIDYTRITVTVDGPVLRNPISRTLEVGPTT